MKRATVSIQYIILNTYENLQIQSRNEVLVEVWSCKVESVLEPFEYVWPIPWFLKVHRPTPCGFHMTKEVIAHDLMSLGPETEKV